MPGAPADAPWPRLARAVIATLGLLVLAAGGCGGSNGETDSSGAATQSKESFIAAANAICTETGEELTAAAGELQGTNGAGALEFISDVTLLKLAEQYDQIAGLAPPDGEAAQVDAFVAAGRRAVEKSRDDPEQLLAPEGGATPFDEPNGLARELGLDQCGG